MICDRGTTQSPSKPHTVRLGGAARGNGVPASSRRGFGAQPRVVKHAAGSFATGCYTLLRTAAARALHCIRRVHAPALRGVTATEPEER